MDVSTFISVTMTTLKVHKVPLDAQGPIGRGLSALVIGRSSATMQGIHVHPAVIDSDFIGQIHAMVSTPSPPATIPERTRIGQITPFKSCVPNTDPKVREDQGFGSTGELQVFWTQVVGDQRPNMMCTITMPRARPSQIKVSGMTDTGADVTIISANSWPSSWPTTPTGSTVAALGGTTQSYLSSKPVLVKSPKGQTATIRPYITAAPLDLWGRDVLSAWGVRLGTDF